MPSPICMAQDGNSFESSDESNKNKELKKEEQNIAEFDSKQKIMLRNNTKVDSVSENVTLTDAINPIVVLPIMKTLISNEKEGCLPDDFSEISKTVKKATACESKDRSTKGSVDEKFRIKTVKDSAQTLEQKENATFLNANHEDKGRCSSKFLEMSDGDECSKDLNYPTQILQKSFSCRWSNLHTRYDDEKRRLFNGTISTNECADVKNKEDALKGETAHLVNMRTRCGVVTYNIYAQRPRIPKVISLINKIGSPVCSYHSERPNLGIHQLEYYEDKGRNYVVTGSANECADVKNREDDLTGETAYQVHRILKPINLGYGKNRANQQIFDDDDGDISETEMPESEYWEKRMSRIDSLPHESKEKVDEFDLPITIQDLFMFPPRVEEEEKKTDIFSSFYSFQHFSHIVEILKLQALVDKIYTKGWYDYTDEFEPSSNELEMSLENDFNEENKFSRSCFDDDYLWYDFKAIIDTFTAFFFPLYHVYFLKDIPNLRRNFEKHSEAFSRRYAALGWDNPKQAKFWRSLENKLSGETSDDRASFSPAQLGFKKDERYQAVYHSGMSYQVSLMQWWSMTLFEQVSQNNKFLLNSTLDLSTAAEKLWEILFGKMKMSIGTSDGIKITSIKTQNKKQPEVETSSQDDGEIADSGRNETMTKTANLQVTAEENALNRKNKPSEESQRLKKLNGFNFDNLSDLMLGLKDSEQMQIEVTREEPEMVKLMVPPQNSTARETTFQGVGNFHYTPEQFSNGGFYFTNDGIVKCYSCHAQHSVDEIVESPPSSTSWHNRNCEHVLRMCSIPPRNRNHIIQSSSEANVRQAPSGSLEFDAATSDNVSEAPGQRSHYIPSGDTRLEVYRLSTFEHFPKADAYFRKALASRGFYYTGFVDQVKCFNCARSVARWGSGDDPNDLKWHKPTCQFAKGEPCGNVKIRNVFGDLAARIAPTQPVAVASRNNVGNQTVIHQRDESTGAVRTVRFPQDLPERMRQTGGHFHIGANNQIVIQNGPVRRPDINFGSRDQPPPPTMNIVVNGPQTRPQVPTWRMANVASIDHKRFLTNLYLNRELDRLTSFARWPTDRPNIPPSALAKTGFYYLGDMDRVQCFSCGGVLRNWTLDDSAEREHRIHFGSCNMVLGNEPLNIPIPSSPESSELLATNYPLRFPSNPHMRGQAQRESTFDRRWPAGRINVSIEQIAEAGFFYLGERDRVKCWYCNGGLQNWEFEDVPWDEHAKWFPNCQFLLRSKGQRFVHQHLAPHAQLGRPLIGRQDGSPLENIRRSNSSRGYDIPPAARRAPTPPPTIIDPQEEMRKRKERVKNILRTSDIVKNVLGMGFSEQVVETVVEDRILAHTDSSPRSDVYESVSELLDDVMKKEEEVKQEEEQRRNETNSMLSNPSEYSSMMSSVSSVGTAPGSGKYQVSYFGDDEEMGEMDMYGGSMEGTSSLMETQAKEIAGETTESIQQQLDKIEEERMCKICFSNVADMLFSPCSHMVCCMECTQAIRHCPICRKQIERAFKTYVK